MQKYKHSISITFLVHHFHQNQQAVQNVTDNLAHTPATMR